MENGENKDLQGRREFFKEAARKALPLLGVVALMSNPVIAKAMEKNACDGCTGSCSYTCSGTCSGACSGGCSGSCKGGCSASCRDACTKYSK
ncbi:MAG: Cys-Xaa-Xaa-Xaa repeat radical SAM target protein [Bacteroidales bacterium]|nr:Cys-Xaa-Xaa-Xaa repeat radical SAM target protein [Bacteroidales bacterium]